MMRNIATATAIGVILALTACLKPADAAQNGYIKRAAVALAVSVVCKVDNDDWTVYATVARIQTGFTKRTVLALIKAEAKHVVNYVIDNDKEDEFCLNGLRDMYGN